MAAKAAAAAYEATKGNIIYDIAMYRKTVLTSHYRYKERTQLSASAR